MTEEINAGSSTGGSIRPLGRLLADAWAIYTANLGRLVKMMLIPLLALVPLIAIIVVNAFFSRFFDSGTLALVNGVAFFLLVLVCVIAVAVLSVISQAGVYLLVRDHERQPSLKEAWGEAKRFGWRFFIVNLAAAFFSFLWLLLFIVPGIIASVYYSLALWALFYEDFQGRAALKRSKELIKKYWWGVLGRMMAPGLIFYAVISIPALYFTGETAKLAVNVITSALSIIAGPFFIVLTALIYLDLVKIKGPSKLASKTG